MQRNYRTKICSCCLKRKPLYMFNTRHADETGYSSKCNKCLIETRVIKLNPKVLNNPKDICCVCGCKKSKIDIDSTYIGCGYNIYTCRDCLLNNIEAYKEKRINAKSFYDSSI